LQMMHMLHLFLQLFMDTVTEGPEKMIREG
jgi:hypothetical protein